MRQEPRFHWWHCTMHWSRRRSVWPSLPAGSRPFAWCETGVFLEWVAGRKPEACVFVPHPDQTGNVLPEKAIAYEWSAI